MKELGKRCGLCHKYKPCRRFWQNIKGKNLLLCRDCWEKHNKLLIEQENKQ